MNYKNLTSIYLFPIITLLSCTPTNFVVTNLPVCTQKEINDLNFVKNKMQGIKGEDPVTNMIFHPPAEKNWPFPVNNINNWIPLSGQKQTLCGELHEFNVYDGAGDEMDWNNYIIPSNDFNFLIDEALPFKGGDGVWCRDDDWQTCIGDNYCMEAEVTPDQSFYENPWFPKSTSNSILENTQVCFYGPWIRECVHGHRPEIHPSELIWWKNNNGYWMMVVQDDSNRFDEDNEFDKDGVVPSIWKPWAEPPITGQFKIPFEIDPNPITIGLPLRMNISTIYERFVVTREDATARADSDNGKSHSLVYNNKKLLTVNEQQRNDSDLGVKFVDICQRSDSIVQGYVQITTKVGGADIFGDEGYQVIFATKPALTIPDTKIDMPPLVQKLSSKDQESSRSWDNSSFRTLNINDTITIVGNLTLKDIDFIELINKTSIKDIQILQDHKKKTLTIINFPVFHADSIEMYNYATRERIKIESIKLKNIPTKITYTAFQKDISSWKRLQTELGNKIWDESSEFGISKICELEVSPQYAPTRDGKTSMEEVSSVTKFLNDAINQDAGKRIKQISQSNTPFNFEWEFKAINLLNKKEVTMSKSNNNEISDISVEIVSNIFINDKIIIHFPLDSNIYKIDINSIATDIFGNRSVSQYSIYSHQLKVDNGLNRDSIVSKFLSAFSVDGTDKNNHLQNMLKIYIGEAVKDKLLTIPEISALYVASKEK